MARCTAVASAWSATCEPPPASRLAVLGDSRREGGGHYFSIPMIMPKNTTAKRPMPTGDERQARRARS
jgi:hypothetical protein